MFKPALTAVALLLAAGTAHADYGDMHLYVRASIYGPETLRMTEVDSVTMKVQQCGADGISCGDPVDYKRPNSKTKKWNWKIPGLDQPYSVAFTAKGNVVFTAHPLSFADDDEANDASVLRAVYRPR